MMIVAAVLAAFLVVAGPDLERLAAPAADLQGRWQLVSGVGPKGAIEPVDGHRITLTGERRRVSGTSGCNQYSATVRTRNGRLIFGRFSITLMACTEKGVMDAERGYLRCSSRSSRAPSTGRIPRARDQEAPPDSPFG